MMRVVLLIVVALGACKSKERWIKTRATELHVSSFVAAIPVGWRDAHELVTPVEEFPVPGSRTLIIDRLDQGGRIDVFPLPISVASRDCTPFVEQVRAQTKGMDITLSDIEGATFDGVPGCMMKLRIGNVQGRVVHGRIALLTMGGPTVGVRCIGDGSAYHEGCDKVIYGLRIAP